MSIQIKLSNDDYKIMKSLKGGLIAVYNSEDEAKNHSRKLFIPDSQSRTAACYYSLSDDLQAMICKLTNILTDGKEHNGFNLALYLQWLTKPDQKANKPGDKANKLKQTTIAKSLVDMENESFIITSATNPTEEYDVASQISKLKRRQRIGEDTPVFQQLRDNLLFGAELIRKGFGPLEIPKTEIVEEYYKHPEFYKKHRKHAYDYKGHEREYLYHTTVKAELEKFAQYMGKTWDDIVDKYYCVVNFSAGYFFLDEFARKFVDDFISLLYRQLQETNVQFQELYLKILEHGINIRKGDFKAIAEYNAALNNP